MKSRNLTCDYKGPKREKEEVTKLDEVGECGSYTGPSSKKNLRFSLEYPARTPLVVPKS